MSAPPAAAGGRFGGKQTRSMRGEAPKTKDAAPPDAAAAEEKPAKKAKKQTKKEREEADKEAAWQKGFAAAVAARNALIEGVKAGFRAADDAPWMSYITADAEDMKIIDHEFPNETPFRMDSLLPKPLTEEEWEPDANVEELEPDAHGKWKRTADKAYGLTYPQCEVPVDIFTEAFRNKFRTILHFKCAQEQHKDGAHHIHVYVEWEERHDVQSHKHFDMFFPKHQKMVGGLMTAIYHPNIKRIHNRAGWLAYIEKEAKGVNLVSFLGEFRVFTARPGMRNKMEADHRWTERYLEKKAAKPIQWPLVLNNIDGIEITMNKPDPRDKQRHWWIVTPPDAGKTYWFERTFGGHKVWKTDNLYPFEGFTDEELVVYDDKYNVTFQEYVDVAGTFYTDTRVPGGSRFTQTHWPKGQTRNIIVLSNRTLEDMWGQTPHYAAMRARFFEIEEPVLMSDEDKKRQQDIENEKAALATKIADAKAQRLARNAAPAAPTLATQVRELLTSSLNYGFGSN